MNHLNLFYLLKFTTKIMAMQWLLKKLYCWDFYWKSSIERGESRVESALGRTLLGWEIMLTRDKKRSNVVVGNNAQHFMSWRHKNENNKNSTSQLFFGLGRAPFWGWEVCGGQQHCAPAREINIAVHSPRNEAFKKLLSLSCCCGGGGDFGCEPLMSLSKAAARDKAEFAFLLPHGPRAISAPAEYIHATHATFHKW